MFHKVVRRHYSGEVKTFKFLYDKCTQDSMYHILSESVGVCRRYGKNILVCFFRFTVDVGLYTVYLETFWYAGNLQKTPNPYIKVNGSWSRSREQKACLCDTKTATLIRRSIIIIIIIYYVAIRLSLIDCNKTASAKCQRLRRRYEVNSLRLNAKQPAKLFIRYSITAELDIMLRMA